MRRRALWINGLVLAGMVIAVTCAGAQPRGEYRDERQMPDGEVGAHIEVLLAVTRSGDEEQIRKLVNEHFAPSFRDAFPMEAHLEQFRQMHFQSRGYDYHGIRHYTSGGQPGETVVIVRNRLTDAWDAFLLRTELTPPHRIAGLQLAPAQPPSDLPAPEPLTEAQIVSELEAFLKRLSEADAFSGAVLLARGDEVLHRSAWRLASKRFDVPNRVDTKFNLGSMNKMFTGVAVARLAQAGKLSFSDPLSRFLGDEWLPKVDKSRVRIEHLLTHTSGLGSYFNEKFMRASRQLFREVDDYQSLVADETLAFEPGTRRQYSNTGMLILGAVIEKASAQSYFDYIREHVYGPAGMESSDSYDMDRPIPNLAIGYERETSDDGPPWRNNLYQHVIRGGPAGGGFSTVDDLYLFGRALLRHRLLDEKHTDLVLSPKPDISSPRYGYGFTIDGRPGSRVVGHGGGFNGISANLSLHLDTGFTVAILSNYGGAARIVRQKIDALLARRTGDR